MPWRGASRCAPLIAGAHVTRLLDWRLLNPPAVATLIRPTLARDQIQSLVSALLQADWGLPPCVPRHCISPQGWFVSRIKIYFLYQ